MGLVYKLNKRLVITQIESKNIKDALKEVDKIKDTHDYTIAAASPALLLSLIDNGYKAHLLHPITDWEIYRNLIYSGVTDIYIDGPLGFCTRELLISKGEALIRVSPQVSANAALFPKDNTANTFYIRPEDLHLYEGIIDVIDFKEPNKDKEDTLFDIYKRGSWLGDLKDLIDTMNVNVKNPYIKPEFGEARLNCQQACNIPGHSCHLCQTQFQLTNLVIDYFSKTDKN